MKIVITSIFANPLHEGHLSLLKAAKLLGDKLVVIVNSDDQVKIKGSKVCLSQTARLDIVSELRCVDACGIAIDKDGTVSESLTQLVKYYNQQRLIQTTIFKEPENIYIFAKGGDRKDDSCMPQSELDICKLYNIQIVYGVGGFDKQNSSSSILKTMHDNS